jgi:hypothetical protein
MDFLFEKILIITMKVPLNKTVYSVNHGLEYFVDWTGTTGTKEMILCFFGLF